MPLPYSEGERGAAPVLLLPERPAVSPPGGILSGFMNRYRPNSFVRDAVVDGGSRMGAGGGVGFVGRAFGGMAAATVPR